MSVYEYSDYKDFLRDQINQLSRRGVITDLARAAGCSHSYLSQVLSGKPELTPDQALAATEFLQLADEEAKFFLILVLKARASTPKLKKHFEGQLKSMKSQKLQLKSAIQPRLGEELSLQDRDIYYSNCNIQIIHTLTACADFQTTSAIAGRLNLSAKEAAGHLDWLMQRGLVKKKDNKYVHSGKNIHLPTESLHNRINHLNWRLKSLDSSANIESVHYTSTFALDKKDMDKLRASLVAFVEKQRDEISRSGSEDIMTFCCDLFQP